MGTSPEPRQIIRFGLYEVDLRAGELRREGRKVKLQEQPFQILALLLEHPGEVVTREELQHKLWPQDTFVDFDAGLNIAIRKLREALGDSADNPRFVETLPRRGYRFLVPVEEASGSAHQDVAVEGLASPGRRSPRRWLLGGALALGTLVAVAVWLNLDGWRERLAHSLGSGAAPTEIRSLAVLPFENLTGEAEQDYFVDGMTEALTTNLAQIRVLRVISRTSAMQYKRARKPLPEIARDLNVDAVVEGAVARSGTRVRVTAQLIHAGTDRHLWAQSYDRELRDVLILQAEVTGAIADAVRAEMRPEERRRLARAQAVQTEAYDEYLKGRFYWSQRSPEGMLRAVEHFEKAIRSDPTYAPAYSGLSDTYRLFDLEGLAAPRECMPKAEAAARRALALDDTLAEAHASLAGVLYRYHWSWDEAEKEFRRSLELDPNYAEGHRAYAIYLMTLRRHEEALVEARRARELSPLSTVINVELGLALVRVGRYDEAIEQLQKALEIDPKFPSAYATLAAAYEGQGDRPKAVTALEKAAALSPRRAHLPGLGYAYAVTGRRREALKMLAELEKLSLQRYVSPQHFAIVHLGLGDKEQALAWLEKAYQERALDVPGLSGRLFKLLSDDPRFQDLLRRIGLPAADGSSLSGAREARPAPGDPIGQ